MAIKNKTELKRLIIKTFLEYVTATFPQYDIDDHGDGGRMTIYNPSDRTHDDQIEFSRSGFSLCTMNWGDEPSEAQSNASKNEVIMQIELDSIVERLTNEYNASKIK